MHLLPQKAQPSPPDLLLYLLAAGAIALAAFGLRMRNLLAMYLFADEAYHIWRAQAILGGAIFTGIEENKWLYSVLLAVFSPTGPESGFIARAVTALIAALTIACCMALGRRLHSRAAGLIAGLLYSFIPYALFHERQALVDPMLAMLMAASLLASLQLVRRPGWASTTVLAGLMLAAGLAKLSGVATFAAPFAAVLLIPNSPDRAARRVRTAALGAGAIVTALALRQGIYLLAAAQGLVPHVTRQAALQNTVLFSLASGSGLGRLLVEARVILEIGWVYCGPAIAVLVALSGLLIAMGRQRRELLYLMAPVAAVCLLTLLADSRPTTGRIPPRYLLMAVPPLVVGSSVALVTASDLVTRARPGLRRAAGWATSGVLLGVLVPALIFNTRLARDPAAARLYPTDAQVYFGSLNNGPGFRPAADYLVARWREAGLPLHVIVNNNHHEWIGAYLGPRVGQTVPFTWSQPGLAADLWRWTQAGEPVYLLDTARYPVELGEAPYGMRLERVGEYSNNGNVITLYRVTGLAADRPEAIYIHPPIVADHFAWQYELALPAIDGSDAVAMWAYPEAHASGLAERSQRAVGILHGGQWPPDPGQTAAWLAKEAAKLPDGSRVDLIVVDEAANDPGFVITRAALTTLYRLGESWHEQVHRVEYVTGPPDLPLTPVGARFEGGIWLEEASLPDQTTAPGAAIRLVLLWRPEQPIADSFSVFVHLVDEQGALVAQSDAVPGGGALPMTAWQPGEAVTDRLAIRLPAGLLPGELAVRVGIYQPASGLRLPVLAAPSAAGDYVTIGTLLIR